MWSSPFLCDDAFSHQVLLIKDCHDLANWLSHYLYFFSFLFFSYLQLQDGVQESITWLCHNITIGMMEVTDGHVTVGHMTRVTWGPWESKRIATVVKYISSREMSENSIEFSLSNSEQRDSWLNSGHWTLDADKDDMSLSLLLSRIFSRLPLLCSWCRFVIWTSLITC